MYQRLFNSLIKYMAPPIVGLVVLQQTPLGQKNALLLVCIFLTISIIPLSLWLGLRILPNLLLIKAKRAAFLIMEIVVAFCTMVGFWLMYITMR